MPANLKEVAFSPDHLNSCKGYDPKFVDGKTNVTASVLSADQKKLLPFVNGNSKELLNYSFFSVAYNSKRKVPFFSACNIDTGKANANAKRANGFQTDPRIPDAMQLNNAFYDLEKNFTEFEIGHMASNDEMSWGKNDDEAQLSAYESFHFPNSVPQAERLNSGLWRSLEQYIIAEGGTAVDKKICVFTGPVLAENDPVYIKDKTFQVPLLFFKVIVFQWKNEMWMTGFIMSHEKRLRDDLKILIYPKPPKKVPKAAPELFNDFKYKKVFQVNINLIEKHTGLKFKWSGVKRVLVPEDAMQLKTIGDTSSAGDIKSKSKKAKRKTVKGKAPKLNMVLPKK